MKLKTSLESIPNIYHFGLDCLCDGHVIKHYEEVKKVPVYKKFLCDGYVINE